MRDLQRCALERQAAEDEVAQQLANAQRSCQSEHDAAIQQVEDHYNRRKQQAETTASDQRQQLETAYEAARSGAQQEYHGLRSAAESDRRKTSAEAQQRHQDEALVILSTFDAQKGQPRRRLEQFAAELKHRREELAAIQRDTQAILTSRRLSSRLASSTAEGSELQAEAAADDTDQAVTQAMDRVTTAVSDARQAAQGLYEEPLSRLLETAPMMGITAAGLALAAGGVGFVAGWSLPVMATGAVAGAFLAVLALWLGIRPLATQRADRLMARLVAAEQRARSWLDSAGKVAEARSRREARELIDRRDRDLSELGFEIEQLVGDMKSRTGEQLKSAGEVFPAKLAEFREEHEAALAEVADRLRKELGKITADRDHELAAVEATHQAAKKTVEVDHEQRWRSMRDDWFARYTTIQSQINVISKECSRRFADFSQIDYRDWEKPVEVAMGVEFGRAWLDVATIKSGMPNDTRLHPEQTTFNLPALITLLEQPSMVVTAEGTGRQRAIALMQAVMLRWITGQPPGKVRFAILDPVGLGEGFNSFMHLADYDENLIATRIWSAGRDIDEQLMRLTQHMETVLQKYLRSEYESIHDYNAQAGEVAEPFQVLVVNGFPNGFNDDTARKLVRLATNGPRCGVYVVMSIDRGERLPSDFRLDDLLASAVHLDWQAAGERFVWNYPAFGKLPLSLAAPPSPDRMVELVKQVGQAAKDAVRVEVPFDVVAPEGDSLWREDCGDELCVPIGRAGANRLQYVRLGKGTSQHLLVAGKTGSGKSTFLHALVTSAAMHFSPDEVEFYLVDFKKGVEFKSYATNQLPHARVVAIESEREFGLSVLQRLDEELSRRGELYRAAGVQNLADYRAAHPGVSMPRILLVIDEFQELFVEDDKLAQDATLLMDRLVRQGRAFGMHAVLGTQTLAGAYSIARSTLGQIAIRVALACSEADAHLILSDERNTAARFLSRPGEAIYNDQNGLLSANELFQVVWLSDRERSDRLALVNGKRQTQGQSENAMVVFEGNAPADPAENTKLVDLLAGSKDAPAQPSQAAIAYLGDAVAIRPPTAVQFGRHGGSNLLIVGPDDQSALGMLTVGAVSLAASNRGARFVVLDATRPGDASAGVWSRVTDVLPEGTTLASAAEAAGAVAEVAAEVARREAESDDSAPPIYLVVYNAGRFRDLRRTEDDFSFSMDTDKPKSPDKHLAEILKSGPGVGVHTLIWCDSYNAVSRLFDRMALREFALRVVMQMSAADSSNLIDTPAASNLKPHRALLYTDETGEIEKLRPYGPPSDAWLSQLQTQKSASPS